MMCFRDMTFCAATERCGTQDCGRRWTPKEQEAARKWWNTDADGEQPPVAFADYSGRDCFQPLAGSATAERISPPSESNRKDGSSQNNTDLSA